MDFDVASFKHWMGLKLSDGFQVAEFLGVGAHHVVFKVANGKQAQVVKLPRNHIAFAVGLPPNGIFPNASDRTKYAESLLSRLASMQGSPQLSGVAPLDNLWTALAVEFLAEHEPGPNNREQYEAVQCCSFVRERLDDWALADIGRSEADMHEQIVIYLGEQPIHADFPEFLARDAKQAKRVFEDFDRRHGEESRGASQNPFLPWMSALSTGFVLPPAAPRFVASALERSDNLARCFRQAGQMAHFIGQQVGRNERAGLVDFVGHVHRVTSNATAEMLQLFTESVLARRG